MKLFAKIGVAVGTGKIQMEGELKPGAVHVLPAINVTNRGDEGSEFEVLVQYHSNIPELAPSRDWFVFSPKNFWLDAEKAQLVEIKLELPVKTQPGDYFCYLEARPVDKSIESSGAKIGVAAATKLNFTVRPANLFQGILYKAASYWKHYAPWSYIIVLVFVLAVIILLLRRFFAFDFGIQRRGKKENKEKRNEKKTDNDLALLGLALSDVEEYTGRLPEKRYEELFSEARYLKKEVFDFLKSGDERILPIFTKELCDVLVLSRKGLENIRKQDKGAYQRSLELVFKGLIGS